MKIVLVICAGVLLAGCVSVSEPIPLTPKTTTKDGARLPVRVNEVGQDNLYEREQKSATMLMKDGTATVSASLWGTKPRILELRVTFTAGWNCTDCGLKDIWVMDLKNKTFLHAATENQVALIVYPMAGSPPPLMNVPQPIVTGVTSTAFNSGSFTGYGYQGSSVATTTPHYNYTLTNMALANNLASTIKRSQILQAGKARKEFVVDRMGTLHAGVMNPGETMSGYLNVAVPNGIKGPFGVIIGGKHGAKGFIFQVPNEEDAE